MALGARVNETPLREPQTPVVDGVSCKIDLPAGRRPRAVAAVQLPYGAVPGLNPVSMDTNDPYTFACGYKQRLLREIPTPQPGALEGLASFVDEWLQANIRPVTPLEFEEWLASTGYNEHRKQQLRDAHDELRDGFPTKRQCQHVDTHGKHESYPEYKHMRTINSRCDAFKAFSGPLFKAIEEELYRHRYFVKHMTPQDRMERVRGINKIGGHCYATDFTAFESHFTPEVMEHLECRLYRHALLQFPRHAKVLCDTITGPNRMRTRWGLRALIQGRRMSGDMCTSLGNGFSNLMLAMYLCRSNGGAFDGIVEGDDGLFVTDVELKAEMWKDLGFTIKIDEVVEPCRASFCGLVFGESGQVIRDPRRFLQTFGWSEDYISASPRVHMELLRAKALSALAETPQCPIVGAIARRAYFTTQGYEARFVDRWRASHTPEWVNVPFLPTSETRMLFQDMYGISPEQQLAAENAIACGDLAFVGSVVIGHKHVHDYASRFIETWQLKSGVGVLPNRGKYTEAIPVG